MGWNGSSGVYRTTNNGINWISTASITVTRQIYFINKDTGWISNGSLFKCTDGGINWVYQPMPSDSTFTITGVRRFHFVNRNLGYGVGGERFFGGGSSGVWFGKQQTGV